MPRFTLPACLVAFAFSALSAIAAPPFAAAERAAVAGQPTALEVAPGSVALTSAHDARQLVLTGKYADGTIRDLTSVADISVEPAGVVEVQDGLYLRPVKNGAASLFLSAGGKQARIAVTVSGMDSPAPISFRNEVIAVLNSSNYPAKRQVQFEIPAPAASLASR